MRDSLVSNPSRIDQFKRQNDFLENGANSVGRNAKPLDLADLKSVAMVWFARRMPRAGTVLKRIFMIARVKFARIGVYRSKGIQVGNIALSMWQKQLIHFLNQRPVFIGSRDIQESQNQGIYRMPVAGSAGENASVLQYCGHALYRFFDCLLILGYRLAEGAGIVAVLQPMCRPQVRHRLFDPRQRTPR